MPVTQHNPEGVFPPYRCYSHATEIHGGARLLIISGLNGYLADGTTMPESFEDQAEIIWTQVRDPRSQAGDLGVVDSLCDGCAVMLLTGAGAPSAHVACCARARVAR